MKDVVIIGGGLGGLFSAYWCVKNSLNAKVISIDESPNLSECEILNLFSLTNEDFKNLADKSLSAALNLNSISYVTNLFKSGLKSQNQSKKLKILIKRYGLKSYEVYENLASDIGGFSFIKEPSTALFFDKKSYKKTLNSIKFGDKEYEILDATGSKDDFGIVNQNIIGAINLTKNARINTQKLYDNLKAYLKNKGVEFVKDEIIHYETGGSKVVFAVGRNGKYDGRSFIQATGVNLNLAKEMGVNLDILPARIYEIGFEVSQNLIPKNPLLLSDLQMKISNQNGKILITTKPKFDLKSELDMSDVNAKLVKLKPFCNNLELKNPTFRAKKLAFSSSGYPIFGRDDGYENLIYLAGFGENETLLAPFVSQILIQMIKYGASNEQSGDVLLFSGLFE